MQISDLIGQYSRNVSQDVSVAAPAPGVQQLVDAVRQMTAGSVFEGTVKYMHKGDVTLGLSNGQSINARLSANVQLKVGQSMFFQVKSNNGNQVEIRPFTRDNLSNPILLKALDSAGVPANERTIHMVNSMMEEQMSIDKNSLMEMARVVSSHSEIPVETVVQMQKLDIPITPELAGQFQKYQTNNAAITAEIANVMENLPDAYLSENLSEDGALLSNGRMLEILTGGMDVILAQEAEMGLNQALGENAFLDMPTVQIVAPKEDENVTITDIAKNMEQEEMMLAADGESEVGAESVLLKSQAEYSQGSAGSILSEQEAGKLQEQLQQFPEVVADTELFHDGKLNLEHSPQKLLFLLQQSMEKGSLPENVSLKELLASEPYQNLLRNVIEQQWLLSPKDVSNPDKMKTIYQKMNHQLSQLEDTFVQTGMNKPELMQVIQEVQDNIQFMNQINQTYTFLQIPLKMSGQNTHGDLYVYSNKKDLADKEGDLTAFLHLDMDHLGSTDVSLRMHGGKVDTNFYMADDISYQLLMEHIGELEEKLQAKGFYCNISVSNQEKKVDFVEDFLKKDHPSTGKLHRYSFDVRA